ncbi:hypothetical protein C8J57DRAFT_320149 [Mycena rebaudengoi]|nr:hypothetical protein C8J57DRAFT_320149 [Mycena rebaudengoi]
MSERAARSSGIVARHLGLVRSEREFGRACSHVEFQSSKASWCALMHWIDGLLGTECDIEEGRGGARCTRKSDLASPGRVAGTDPIGSFEDVVSASSSAFGRLPAPKTATEHVQPVGTDADFRFPRSPVYGYSRRLSQCAYKFFLCATCIASPCRHFTFRCRSLASRRAPCLRFVDARYHRFRLLACYRSSAHIVPLSLLALLL